MNKYSFRLAFTIFTSIFFLQIGLGLNVYAERITKEQLQVRIDQLCTGIENKVIAWRRDIHQNSELGNQEFRTSQLVTGHLRQLGLEVKIGIAHTGVVGILRGKRPGPVVALRADILRVGRNTRGAGSPMRNM